MVVRAFHLLLSVCAGVTAAIALLIVSVEVVNAQVTLTPACMAPSDQSCDGFIQIYKNGPVNGCLCGVYEPLRITRLPTGDICTDNDVVCSLTAANGTSTLYHVECKSGPATCSTAVENPAPTRVSVNYNLIFAISRLTNPALKASQMLQLLMALGLSFDEAIQLAQALSGAADTYEFRKILTQRLLAMNRPVQIVFGSKTGTASVVPITKGKCDRVIATASIWCAALRLYGQKQLADFDAYYVKPDGTWGELVDCSAYDGSNMVIIVPKTCAAAGSARKMPDSIELPR